MTRRPTKDRLPLKGDQSEELPDWGSVAMSALAVLLFAGLAGLWNLYILSTAAMGYDSCGGSHHCNKTLEFVALIVTPVAFLGGLILMLAGVARYAFGKRDSQRWKIVGGTTLFLSGFLGTVLIAQATSIPIS